MGEGYDKPDEKLKTDRKMFSIGQKEKTDLMKTSQMKNPQERDR